MWRSADEQTMDAIRSMQPVEFSGVGGDVMFWHHRLCHAAGQNFSRNIRMSCLYDFAQTRMDLDDEDGHLIPGSPLDRPPTVWANGGQLFTHFFKCSFS
jgi:ectoine hydroxylase-related dioxygenase (phytanoyl-CoA dioxygenase family)